MVIDQQKLVGFARFPPDQRHDIASRGARIGQARGVCHRWRSAEEASAAGKKGAEVRRQRREDEAEKLDS
jgi:hypothetical protein